MASVRNLRMHPGFEPFFLEIMIMRLPLTRGVLFLSGLLVAGNLACAQPEAPSAQPGGPTAQPGGPAALPAGMASLFDSKSLEGWIQQPANSWKVQDGVMASTGAGRGVIYTKDDYVRYRLMFTMRQVKGNHQPCFLIFCTRPAPGEKGLDALGGIQFQVPNGGHWDYRPGKNKSGAGFSSPAKTKFDNKQWSRVEILVDAEAGTARMAVAQPVGSKAIENLDYKMPEAGKKGPIAWQMHNKGLFDEYKDVVIEINPKLNDLITTK
jgi:hypothetical protein